MHPVELRDSAGTREALLRIRPDWVFHLAAFGAYPAQTGMGAMVETNLMAAVTLLDACAAMGVEAYVQTGSSSEYGFKDHPAREDEAIEPNSHYAITKAAATHYAQFTSRQRGLHAVTLRLYSVYGPYEEPSRLIPTLLVSGFERRLPPLVSPAVARDFVFVDDAVEAVLQVAAHPGLPRGSVYNVCSGTQSTVASVVALVRQLLAVAAEPVWSSMESRAWDTNSWVGSPEAIGQQVQWKARVDMETGLRRTVEWFRENPDLLEMYSRSIS
jgi:dolichol-phosphate mannosyltransferase